VSTQTNYRRLSPWEEAVGVLEQLTEGEDVLVAKIGRITLALPTGLGDTLRPYLGQRIALLRCDAPARPYRVRTFDFVATKNSPAGGANTGGSDEHCARTTGATE
jgi:hypothetical protein